MDQWSEIGVTKLGTRGKPSEKIRLPREEKMARGEGGGFRASLSIMNHDIAVKGGEEVEVG